MPFDVIVSRTQYDQTLHVRGPNDAYWNLIVTGATPVPRVVAQWFNTITQVELSTAKWNAREVTPNRFWAEPYGGSVLWEGTGYHYNLWLKHPAGTVQFFSDVLVPDCVRDWMRGLVAIEVVVGDPMRVLTAEPVIPGG